MQERGYTYQALADKLGYRSASGVGERLRNKNAMRVDVMFKMLEAMDCELVVRSKTAPNKEWVVTMDDGNKEAVPL